MDNSQAFKKAHQMTKQVIKAGDNYQATFGACLKIVIREAMSNEQKHIEDKKAAQARIFRRQTEWAIEEAFDFASIACTYAIIVCLVVFLCSLLSGMVGLLSVPTAMGGIHGSLVGIVSMVGFGVFAWLVAAVARIGNRLIPLEA